MLKAADIVGMADNIEFQTGIGLQQFDNGYEASA